VLGHLLLPEIRELIRSGDFSVLHYALRELTAPDLAELINEVPAGDKAVLFRLAPRSLAGETFEHLELTDQEELLRAFGERETADILNVMSPDDRTQLLEELPAEATRRLLTLLSPEEMQVAKTLLGYPEDSIGRRMTPDYVAIRSDLNVEQTLSHVRRFGRASETLDVLYVVDEQGHLEDDLQTRELLVAPLDKPIADLMSNEVVSLMATDDQETAVTAFKKYGATALPVTDSQGKLLGIVTVDDVLHVAEEEATEDIHKLGGLEALDMPYMATPFLEMVRKRAGWLVILFVGELFTATAMTHFADEQKRAAVLGFFVPLIISSGGNSGSQAASLMIRALALGEVGLIDWWRVVRRELASGVALGSILGILGFLRITIWSQFSTVYGEHWFLVAVAIAFSLVGVVLWGTISGSMLPFILKRLGADPATSSAPFVATLVDVTGLIIYFTVASIILRGTLL